MSNEEIDRENIVVLFMTYEDQKRDEEAILVDFILDWDAAWEKFETARDAILYGSAAPLAKVIDTSDSPLAALKKSGKLAKLAKLDPSLAKKVEAISNEFAIVEAEHVRMTKQFDARNSAIKNLEDAKRAAIDRRDRRLYGLGAVAKRSQRFANAHERRNSGAPSLPPAS
jgi:hypothetical protein